MKTILRSYGQIILMSAGLLIFSSRTNAQDTVEGKSQSLTLKTEFQQIKDNFNYGLVFSGINLVGKYSLEKSFEKSTFIYSPELGLGVNYNKELGFSLGFVPLDLYYGLKVKNSIAGPLTIGGYITTDYNWQFYPDLQSGHMFWFTSIEIGPQILFTLPVKDRKIEIILSNSLAGYTSRPDPGTETYFYSLRFSDFISNVHSNLQFGSFNKFNHTNIVAKLQPSRNKRLFLAYEFEYFGYYNNPKLNYLSHSLNLNWKIGKL